MSQAKRVLVCGATGYLGGYVLEAAKARGHWVRALVRDASRFEGSCDDVFVGQATEAATLQGMCQDIDVVFSSLGNRTLKRTPTVWDVDFAANMNILHEAERAGVEQLIFVSVLGGDEMRARVPQFEARERVVDALKAGALPWTIIRPSGFFNDMSEILDMARRGTVWIPGGDSRFNPIHGADLAEVCVDPVGDELSYGKEIPAGGPDVLTMEQVAELAFGALDTSPKIRSFPPSMLSAAAAVIRPFNVNVASLLQMFTAFSGDATCDRYGSHHLGDFFQELAAG
jgi:uncharacterized protein YbjT (DUF2867 family)